MFVAYLCCKYCAKVIDRSSPTSLRKFCSIECRDNRAKLKYCKPCDPKTYVTTEVFFKDGSTHLRQTCGVCNKYIAYIPKTTQQAKVPLTGLENFEIKQKQIIKKYGDNFYTSRAWLTLRFQALQKLKKECVICNAKYTELHVDHIKPKSKFPELALDINNLQILCRACNLGKSNSVLE
jgi:hypothetical protein